MWTIFRLLRHLDGLGLACVLDRTRPDTIRVTVTLVGERIESDCFEDGHVEFCRFRGSEAVETEADALRAILGSGAGWEGAGAGDA